MVFYVGVGNTERPFSRRKSHRNALWLAQIESLPAFDVDVILWTDKREEALRFEANLIKELRPECNQLMNGYTNPDRNRRVGEVMRGKSLSQETRQKIGETRRIMKLGGKVGYVFSEESKQKIRATRKCTAVRCNETGVEYPSLTVAAASLKIRKQSLMDHIHGRVDHVQGLTFSILQAGTRPTVRTRPCRESRRAA